MSSYDDVYNTEDLTGKAGIVLFKQYVAETTINNTNANINDAVTRYTGSTSWHADVPKSMIESYLCTDGKPIATSTVYAGDDSMYTGFRNRDRRLCFSVIPILPANYLCILCALCVHKCSKFANHFFLDAPTR